MAIPGKGKFKITVPEDYELVLCESNKEAVFLGSGRYVEIKGSRQPSGALYWIPQRPQTITYSKDGCKIQLSVRFFNPAKLINNSSVSLDLRTMLKPLAQYIDRLMGEQTSTHALRASIEAAANELIEPLGLDLVVEDNIEKKKGGNNYVG
jgi:hypothetical protein